METHHRSFTISGSGWDKLKKCERIHMCINFQIRHWLKGAIIIAISLFSVSLTNAATKGAELDEDRLELLKLFVANQGTMPTLIQGFENEAIRALIKQLKLEPKPYNQENILRTLYNTIDQIKGLDPELVSARKSAIYERMTIGIQKFANWR